MWFRTRPAGERIDAHPLGWLQRWQGLPGTPWVRKAVIGIGTFLALTTIIGVQHITPRVEFREGQVSPRDVEAPLTIEVIDRNRTEALRRQAAGTIQPAYQQSAEATERARQIVSQVFLAIERVRSTAGLGETARGAMLRQESPIPLSDPAIRAALTLERATLEAARTAALQVVEQKMAGGIRPGDLPRIQAEARVHIRSLPIAGRALTLVSAVVARALQPNLLIDDVATEVLRRRAIDAVEPVTTRILRGEVIVRRGEVVTAAHMQKLVAVGVAQSPFSWERLLGMGLISLLLLLVTAAYLRQYQPDIWAQDKLLLVWSLSTVLTTVLARILVTRVNPYLIPTAAGTILVAVLLQQRLALYTAPVLSLLVAIVAGGDVRLGLVTFVGSTVGVYAIRRINHRTDLVVAGFLVGIANALAITAVGLAEQLTWYPHLVRDAAFGLGNGILVGVIVIGALPYLEDPFGLVTPIKLLELSNPSHPLLRRLQTEAPGTYHHSIVVANLAEAAAEAIGGDSLLVRVGTYYHDVGKIRRPVFFAENQVGVENPHDKMAPSLSALTILAHVRDGLDYAREYRLPKAVTDFIPQHHGTNVIRYFYHQAVRRGDAADEDAFRYEGPKPQTRETAIVMLADAAEGAIRAMTRPTPERIEQVVRRIIREKLDDRQLDECDLTFRDLDLIAQSFTRVLASMFHPRVEYPDLERDLRGRRDRAASGR